jgi:GTP cyclohydrolase IA
MSSNVHALEGIRPLRAEIDRPDRTDVEAAFRTIIRWTGDDPEREGLVETPARMARAFEEFFPATPRTQSNSCKKPPRKSKVMTK